MMLAGLPVPPDAVEELAQLVRAIGAADLADRLEVALGDGVALLALTLDERAIILWSLQDAPDGLAAPRRPTRGTRMASAQRPRRVSASRTLCRMTLGRPRSVILP